MFYRRFYGGALCCAISLLVTEQLSTNQLKFKLGIVANLKEFFLTVVCFDGYELVQVESWNKNPGRVYFTISCRFYKVTEHPKYKNGEWSEEQVFKEFLESFEPDPSSRDAKVSCARASKLNSLYKLSNLRFNLGWFLASLLICPEVSS